MEGILPGTSQSRALAADLDPQRRLPVVALGWAALLASALVARAEVDRVVSGVVGGDAAGGSTASAVTGLGAVLGGAQATWQRWAALAPPMPGEVAGWLGWHLLLGLLLVAGYVGLVRAWLPRTWTAPRRVVVLVGAANVVQDLLIWPAAAGLTQGHVPAPALLSALRIASGVTWLLGAVLVAWIVAAFVADPAARESTGRSLRALFLQRYSLAVAAVVVLLVAVPRGEVFEQMPDVLRSWLDGPGGLVHAGAALACLLLLVVVLLFVGRMRSRRAWEAYAAGWVPDRPSRGWAWVGVPLVLVCVGGVLAVAGAGRLFPAQTAAFVGVPLALAASSWVIVRASRWWSWRHLPELAAGTIRGRVDETGLWIPPPRSQDLALVATTRVTGDVLALLVLAAAGVGLVRAFTAPALLGVGGAGPVVLVPVGILAAAGCWWAADAALRTLAVDAPGASVRPTSWSSDGGTGLALGLTVGWPARRVVLGVLGACAASGILLVLWPRHVSAAVGVVATVLLALTVLAAGLGTWVYLSQERLPLGVFRVFRLRATPILCILLAVAWLGSAPEQAGLLHALRPGPASAGEVPRPTLRAALDTWLAQGHPAACTLEVTLPRTGSATEAGATGAGPVDAAGSVDGTGTARAIVSVAPLLLVAAEGGGIRAAAWTVEVMDRVQADTPGGRCARSAVLASSGVSGGAVGLALLARAARPAAAVEQIAGPQALGATLAGLLAGDLLAGMTGVGVRALDAGTPADSYADRAALMEATWADAAPGLDDPLVGSDPPGRMGRLVLNATSVAPPCRVLVSDVDLGGSLPTPTANGDGPACTALDSTGPAASYDLLTAYGACLSGLRASTAAMLSARFTAVTPTGHVPACQRRGDQQLVDGGYAEGSGLLTVLDLLAALRLPVQRHNDQVLACATGRTAGLDCAALGDHPVVAVPLVLFLENHYRQDLSSASARRANEVLAPGEAVSAREVVAGTDALLQRTRDTVIRTPVCDDPGPACARVSAAVQDWTARRVFLVSPRTRPQVEAPLGWVLSQASRDSLAAAVEDAARPCPQGGGCLPRMGGLGDAQAAFAALGVR